MRGLFLIVILSVLFLVFAILVFRRHGTQLDVEVRPSPLGGRGVFACRSFKAGEVIERCHTISKHGDEWGTATTDYVFNGTYNEQNSVLVLGNGSLFNHSDDANAAYELADNDNIMIYTAKRPITRGDEITVDYGSDWFEGRKYQKNT